MSGVDNLNTRWDYRYMSTSDTYTITKMDAWLLTIYSGDMVEHYAFTTKKRAVGFAERMGAVAK